MRGVHDGLGDFALQARQADVQPRSEEINVARIAQVDFGIDSSIIRKLHLHLVGHNPHRTNETGRPASGKQLLWVGAGSGNSGGRKLHIQAAIITAGDAATPTAVMMAAWM